MFSGRRSFTPGRRNRYSITMRKWPDRKTRISRGSRPNAKRLTDPQTVEHFLRVNCALVFKRACSAKEKGDVLVWLGGIK